MTAIVSLMLLPNTPSVYDHLPRRRRRQSPHSRDVARFLGLRPKQCQSGARDPQLEISKSGDPYLRKLPVQCSAGLQP